MKKSTNYKIKPFEYKKTKLCPICNSKLKIEYYKYKDNILKGVFYKSKNKICINKDHMYSTENQYDDDYDVFFTEIIGLNKILTEYEYVFSYFGNGIIDFAYTNPQNLDIHTTTTRFDLTRKKKLAYKIREAILNQNENLLKKIMLLL